jgi:hypothetical protein
MRRKRGRFSGYFLIGAIVLLVIVFVLSVVSLMEGVGEGESSSGDVSTIGYVTLTIVEPPRNIEDINEKEKA